MELENVLLPRQTNNAAHVQTWHTTNLKYTMIFNVYSTKSFVPLCPFIVSWAIKVCSCNTSTWRIYTLSHLMYSLATCKAISSMSVTVRWFYACETINCELRVFPEFAINKFININVCIYYNTVRGRPFAIIRFAIWPDLDKMQSLNHAI